MRTSIKKILFTTDLSERIRSAFDFLASIACHQGADIIILHVMGHPIRSKLGETVLGSTTRRVLRRSRIPVLLVPLLEED